MSERVYTERFLATIAVGWTYWTVPAGKRAIVRQVDVCNVNAAAQAAVIQLHGFSFVNQSIPASGGTIHWSGTQVLYAGEQLAVYLQAGNMSAMVSGYLFDDP